MEQTEPNAGLSATGRGERPMHDEAGRLAPFIRRSQVVRLVIGLSALCLVTIGLASVAQDAPGALEVLSDASAPWLMGAIAAEAVCYLFIGMLLHGLLGPGLGRFVSVRAGLLIYGLGSVLPGSPAPGMALAGGELRRRGIAGSRLGLALFWCTWFNVRAFLVLAAWTAASAAVRGRTPEGTGLGVVVGVCLVAGVLALGTALVQSPAAAERLGRLAARLRWRGSRDAIRQLSGQLHVEAMTMVGGRRRQMLFGAAALGSWVGDAVCLRLALIALGIHVSMGIVLIAYVVTNLVALIPILPGGLGVVELTVAGVLNHYGVSIDRAVAGTLAWRAVSLFLPALAGLVMYGSFHWPRRRQREARAPA